MLSSAPREPLTCWTIQDAAFFKPSDDAPLTATWDRVDPHFFQAYRWMSDQMSRRLGVPPHTCPLWAWHKYDGQNAQPNNLTDPDAWHLPPGSQGVCIAFTLPADRVLLSQFDAWHCVLNRHPFVLHAEPDNKESGDTDTMSPTAMRQSWEHIFNPSAGDPEAWGTPSERQIQACVAEIPRHAIQNVTHFRVGH